MTNSKVFKESDLRLWMLKYRSIGEENFRKKYGDDKAKAVKEYVENKEKLHKGLDSIPELD